MRVIKSNGKLENFKLSKLVDSLIGTFEMAQTPEGMSNDLIRQTIKDFHAWQIGKNEITSQDIRLKISSILKKIHPEASYIYKNFKSII
jgi:ATP cone domain